MPPCLLAALADADATLGRVGEASLVVGKLEVRLDLGRMIVRAEPEVLAGQVRVHHLVRVHLVVGSQIALNSPNARTSSGPNILGKSAAFDWPSPCSPEIEPP